MENRGLTHVYYGDGKGKTTAAMGLALRALGWGRRVLVVQFLKNRPSGEVTALQRFENARVLRGQASDKFVFGMTDAEKAETAAMHNTNLKMAMQAANEWDVLVLDEAMDACRLGVLDTALLAGLLDNKPPQLELVITGHQPEPWILEHADYITEMRKQKHPYDAGVQAREGIEY